MNTDPVEYAEEHKITWGTRRVIRELDRHHTCPEDRARFWTEVRPSLECELGENTRYNAADVLIWLGY